MPVSVSLDPRPFLLAGNEEKVQSLYRKLGDPELEGSVA
jgi:hypothetical protein